MAPDSISRMPLSRSTMAGIFWFGLMAIFIFALKLGWLPSGGMYTLGGDEDILDLVRHLILPTVVLSLVLVAQWSRYTRSSFLEVIHQDYIRTAKSKGLGSGRILHLVTNGHFVALLDEPGHVAVVAMAGALNIGFYLSQALLQFEKVHTGLQVRVGFCHCK